jgi:hypothetical protein
MDSSMLIVVATLVFVFRIKKNDNNVVGSHSCFFLAVVCFES